MALSDSSVALQIFPRADIPRFRILENPSSVPKSTILVDQDVSYFRDPNASSPTKVCFAHTTSADILTPTFILDRPLTHF